MRGLKGTEVLKITRGFQGPGELKVTRRFKGTEGLLSNVGK
jgi:hypothetical protein